MSATFSPDEIEAFLAAVDGYTAEATPAHSAATLRKLIRSGALQYLDMQRRPQRFFAAHRLLATRFDEGVGGFGIRFTVQFNLFVGSIIGLGSDDQIAQLEQYQQEGTLGCFALTEMGAGVMSGLIVETEARWLPESQEFEIHTPTDRAQKNWISQGLTAELCVVMARLTVDGEALGPHPFLVRIREPVQGGEGVGALVPGVRAEDMGGKTVANDLDNARLRFDRMRAPPGALLAKFCRMEGEPGALRYVRGAEPMRIEVIGQRLLTGRLCIAQAALVATRKLFANAYAFAGSKQCNAASGTVALAALPQLHSLRVRAAAELSRQERFAAAVEARLAVCLNTGAIATADLVEAIGVTKICAIRSCIELAHALQQELGSYALMAHTGFEHLDMLQCCKFAEGDSRVLMQKMARDRLKQFRSDGVVTSVVRDGLGGLLSSAPGAAEASDEMWACLALARELSSASSMAEAWDAQWQRVYALADRVCDRHFAAALGGAGGESTSSAEPFPEITSRL